MILAIILLVACGTQGDRIQQEDSGRSNMPVIDPITIRFGHVGPNDATDQIHYGALAFAQKVNELSGGVMSVHIYPASQLGTSVELAGMLQRGELHMADIENATLTGFVPETAWADLPYIIQSYEHAEAVFNARSEVSRWIRPLFADNGFRILGVYHAGFRHMMNNTRPIHHPNDMQGMIMRVMPSETMVQSMNAFGAEAVILSFGDPLMSAIIAGEIDGNEQPLSLVYSSRFFDVQRYLSLTGHFYNPRNYIFSETLWQQLTPAQQLIVIDAKEYALERMNAHHHASQARLLQSIRDNGMTVNEVNAMGLNAFQELGATIWPMSYEMIGSGNTARGSVIIDMILSYIP